MFVHVCLICNAGVRGSQWPPMPDASITNNVRLPFKSACGESLRPSARSASSLFELHTNGDPVWQVLHSLKKRLLTLKVYFVPELKVFRLQVGTRAFGFGESSPAIRYIRIATSVLTCFRVVKCQLGGLVSRIETHALHSRQTIPTHAKSVCPSQYR